MHPMTVREIVGHTSGPTFFDAIADPSGPALAPPRVPPDLRGYVALALRSGFPDPALRLTNEHAHRSWLESYVEDLLTRDVAQLEDGSGRGRDIARLRSYFEAYTLNAAGVSDHKTIYDAAGVTKLTAAAYERLLDDLLIVDRIPAWTPNQLKRLVHNPKRQLIDAALIATVLRLDVEGILRDGNLLGRVLDTFVTAQLRAEGAHSTTRPRLHHLRTQQGRHEVDLVAELAGQRAIGMEIKASAAPTVGDARHLAWMRDELGDRFYLGIVFHTGPRLFQLSDRIIAAPIATLWGPRSTAA
jgi:predicted AAA+ superfamily ATPase